MSLHVIQDIRHGGRLLLKTPGFSFIAILTLALGIGANTAVFTIVNGILLRPLPYLEPERLVTVWQDLRRRGGPPDEAVTPGNYADWRRESSLFERIAVITGWRPTLTGVAEPEPLEGEQVSHEYFDTLGVAPALGRGLAQTDDVPNAARVVIVSDGLWRRRFGADPAAVGRMVTLQGQPHQIIGVLPAGFRPIINPNAEVWRPLRLNTVAPSRGAVILRSVARLAPGLTLERARAAADLLAGRLEAAHPDFNERSGINLIPLHERVVGDIAPGLLALAGAVAFVLLIACANLANLLLARGSARAREIAVRGALGAGRARIVGQLLTESLVLASIGGAGGILLAWWGVDALVAIAPDRAPRVNEIVLDLRVFGFAALLTIATGALFGIAPALQLSGSAARALKEGGRGHSTASGRRLRGLLVAAEVALALVLLTGGGLLLQTFVRLQSADLGFKPEQVLVAQVNPPNTRYDTIEKHRVFYDQALERAAALPGVRVAALASVLPLSGDSDMDFEIEGAVPAALRSRELVTWYRLVSARYFEAMGMAIASGRGFQDREATPSVVVSQTLAARFFGGEAALGRRVRFQPDGPWFTIVGIAGDVKSRGARSTSQAEMYIPYWQRTERGMNLVLRSDVSPEKLIAPLRAAVTSLDPDVPLSGVAPLSDLVGDSIAQSRFFALLAGGFALLALAMAAVGIYGVMACVVAQRTVEIGVRMALGATAAQVFGLVVRDGLVLTVAGVAAGVAGSAAAAQGLGTLLFGVRAGDPWTLTATAGLLFFVAALACALPARRAARVDPMVALRAE